MDTSELADLQKHCADTGCHVDDLAKAMIDWDWERQIDRERVKRIHAVSMPNEEDLSS